MSYKKIDTKASFLNVLTVHCSYITRLYVQCWKHGSEWWYKLCFDPKACSSRLFCRYRFDGYNSDNTILIISKDKLRMQCRSVTWRNETLCGNSPLNLPPRKAFTPTLVFRGARFRPQDGHQYQGDTRRSRYTWSATYYRLLGRTASCEWLGECPCIVIMHFTHLWYTTSGIKLVILDSRDLNLYDGQLSSYPW